MQIEIIGNGVFGTFAFGLMKIFAAGHAVRLVDPLTEDPSKDADISLLALPSHAYYSVLGRYSWK